MNSKIDLDNLYDSDDDIINNEIQNVNVTNELFIDTSDDKDKDNDNDKDKENDKENDEENKETDFKIQNKLLVDSTRNVSSKFVNDLMNNVVNKLSNNLNIHTDHKIANKQENRETLLEDFTEDNKDNINYVEITKEIPKKIEDNELKELNDFLNSDFAKHIFIKLNIVGIFMYGYLNKYRQKKISEYSIIEVLLVITSFILIFKTIYNFTDLLSSLCCLIYQMKLCFESVNNVLINIKKKEHDKRAIQELINWTMYFCLFAILLTFESLFSFLPVYYIFKTIILILASIDNSKKIILKPFYYKTNKLLLLMFNNKE